MAELLRPKLTHAYDREMAKNVVFLYASGFTLEEIADDHDRTPNDAYTIMAWSNSMPEFAEALMFARSTFALIHAEATLSAHKDNRDPQLARLQMVSAQWLASKYDPATYGEKLSIEIEHKIDLTQAIEDARERMSLANGVVLEHEELLEGS